MQYVFLAVVLAGFVIGLGQVWLKRRREAPLRREIRSQSVTFSTRLSQVKVKEGYGWPRWLSLNSSMALCVRGDSLDISSTNLPIRVVMGMEYYFGHLQGVRISRWDSIRVTRLPGMIRPVGIG